MDTTRRALEGARLERAASFLNPYIKGLIPRDYSDHDRAYYTCSVESALQAIDAALTSMDAAPQGDVDLETWLRIHCFQAPPQHAYDLAKAAWDAAKSRTTPKEPDTDRLDKAVNEAAEWYLNLPDQPHRKGVIVMGNDGSGYTLSIEAKELLRSRLTPLFRTTPAVALRSGGYDELWRHVLAGGEAIGLCAPDNNPSVFRIVRKKGFDDNCLFNIEIDGVWQFVPNTEPAFISECTRLGLQYILIQPEQK